MGRRANRKKELMLKSNWKKKEKLNLIKKEEACLYHIYGTQKVSDEIRIKTAALFLCKKMHLIKNTTFKSRLEKIKRGETHVAYRY